MNVSKTRSHEDTNIITDRKLVLGICTNVDPEGKWGSFLPIAWTANKTSWNAVKTANQEYPNKGEVTWLIQPDGALPARKGIPSSFRVAPKPNYDPDHPGRDKFHAVDIKPVKELLLPVGPAKDAETARTNLVSGIRLRYAPSRYLYVRIAGSKMVGPVTLEEAENGLWRLHLDEHCTEVAVHDLPDSKEMFSAPVLQRTFILRLTGKPTDWVDWGSDRLILKRTLEAIRSQNPKSKNKADWTNKAIKSAAETIAALGDSKAQQLLANRYNRARSILRSIGSGGSLVTEMLEEFQQLPVVKDAIERALTEAKKQVKQEAEKAVTAKRTEVRELTKTLDEGSKTLKRIEKDIEKKREDQRKEIQLASEELDSLLSDLAKKPHKALTASALARALMQGAGGHKPESPTTHGSELSVPTSKTTPLPEIPEYHEEEKFVSTAKKQLSACGVSRAPFITCALHSAVLARRVPVMDGENGLRMLDAYARALTGHQAHIVPIAPGLESYAELFGQYSYLRSTFIPSSNGLSNLIKNLATKDELRLVVFEGINRAAMELYLLPLLRSYAKETIALPGRLSAYTARLAQDTDEYRFLVDFDWPENLILTGVTTGGPTALPFLRDAWHYLMYVPFRVGTSTSSTDPPQERATRKLIQQWRDSINANRTVSISIEAIDEWVKMAEVSDLVSTSTLFTSTLLRLVKSEDETLNSLVGTILLPASAGKAALRSDNLQLLPEGIQTSPWVEQSVAKWNS